MTVCDLDRLVRIVTDVLKRIEMCPLPGRYLWEYIGYTCRREKIVSTTVYLHEPEWLTTGESRRQREAVISCLRRVLGRSFHEEVFMPEGKLVRIDPSFKLSDTPLRIRLEIFYNLSLETRGRDYLFFLAKLVFGDVRAAAFVESAGDSVLPYHVALTFDGESGRFIELKFYRKQAGDSGAFSGETFSSDCKLLVRKDYSPCSLEPNEPGGRRLMPVWFNHLNDCGLSMKYIAFENGKHGKTAAVKYYFFNERWKDGEIGL